MGKDICTGAVSSLLVIQQIKSQPSNYSTTLVCWRQTFSLFFPSYAFLSLPTYHIGGSGRVSDVLVAVVACGQVFHDLRLFSNTCVFFVCRWSQFCFFFALVKDLISCEAHRHPALFTSATGGGNLSYVAWSTRFRTNEPDHTLTRDDFLIETQIRLIFTKPKNKPIRKHVPKQAGDRAEITLLWILPIFEFCRKIWK